MTDASGKTGRQLFQPGLGHRRPTAVRMTVKEILSASAGAVDAAHDAEQCRPTFRPRDFWRDRSPHRIVGRVESHVPDRPDRAARHGLEEDDLFLGGRIARIGASRLVFRRKHERPCVASRTPSPKTKRLVRNHFTASAQKTVAVGC